MYYLELIQRFWNFNQKTHIGPTAIAMYLYLLKTANDNDAYDFQISDVVVSNELGLTRKTAKYTKEKLRDLGLIRFEAKNGFPCNYRLILNYPLEIFETETENGKNEEFEPEAAFLKPEESTLAPPIVLPIKILPENTDQEAEIQSSIGIQLSQPQPIPIPIPIPKGNDKNIPDLDEFMEYAKTLESYEVGLDSDIKSKYNSWMENGWKNGSDRPITNWKSTLKSSLPFMKNTTVNDQFSIQKIPNIKRPKSQNGD